MDSDTIKASYREVFGEAPQSATAMPGAGSSRRYWRLSGVRDVVACVGDNAVEMRDFHLLADYFASKGVNVPQVYFRDSSGILMFQQDLGDMSLCGMLGSGEDAVEEIVKESLRQLVKMQTCPVKEWAGLTSQPPFSRRRVLWDLNYFKYEFVKPLGIVFDEDALEDDFEALASRLSSIPEEHRGFMYRDFQSRNVMVVDGIPYMIDFQGGMQGPCLYDAVSFLWQSRAGFSDVFREKMVHFYADEFAACRHVERGELLAFLDLIVLFRTLQTLGAYGFRGLIEGKAQFVTSIPGGCLNLRKCLESGVLDPFPMLHGICCQIADDSRFQTPPQDRLTVEVGSFSFKKGYPKNFTGNGGGFIFDCRSLPNPGRYAEYKKYTGMDTCVEEFFSRTPDMDEFLSNVFRLVDRSVRQYLERGFTHLQIYFGCTGGQHRSVYGAERTAAHVRRRLQQDNYGVSLDRKAQVRVIHREQGVEK